MNKVIIGVSNKGLRTAVVLPSNIASKVITNPSTAGLSKVNAVMTENTYNNTIKEYK